MFLFRSRNRNRNRCLTTEPGIYPCSDFGAGPGPAVLFRSRNRNRCHISEPDPGPQSYFGAGIGVRRRTRTRKSDTLGHHSLRKFSPPGDFVRSYFQGLGSAPRAKPPGMRTRVRALCADITRQNLTFQ